MVPSNSNTGMGSISGTYNPVNNLLTYSTSWNNLSGAPKSGGFYTGGTGITGSAIGNSWSYGTAAMNTGSRSDTLTLNPAQASQLLKGNWYYSYGTTSNPNGEIRGQISATR